MDFHEFHGRACDVAIKVREAAETAGLAEQEFPYPDLRELLTVVRTAASWIGLSGSVDEAIERLKQDLKELAAVDYVANFALDNPRTKLVMRLSFVGESGRDPSVLPCMPFAAYLLELCNGLEPGK